MFEELKGGETSSYNNTQDYNIKNVSVEDYTSSVEFKAIKELLVEDNLIYVTEFIRKLLDIKKPNDTTCFTCGNGNKIVYKNGYGKRAILYLRLSVEDMQKKDTTPSKSILNQLLLLLQYCKEHEIEVVGIFYEEGISGADENRPEWNKSLVFCEKGHCDIYITKTQARFARDVEMIERYLHKRFIEWNIRFLSIVDHSDTSQKGNKLQRQITAIVDENKLSEQSINTKATLRGKNQAGQWTGSFACYGYIEDPNDMYHLVPDPPAAKIVQKIYELYANGTGYFKICKYLNEHNIPTPSKYKKLQGSKFKCCKAPNGSEFWNIDTVRKILKDETYDGLLIQNRTETISYNIKKARKLPRSEQTIIACAHERIVDPVISRIVRQKFEARTNATCDNIDTIHTRPKPDKNGEVHIFSQKVYCAECGKIFQKTTAKSGPRKNPTKKDYLHCKTNKRTCQTGCTNNSSIRIEVLEQVVLEEINKQIDKYYNEEKFNKSYYEKKVNTNYENEIKALQEEKIMLDKKIKDNTNRFTLLYEDRANEVITTQEFILLKSKYNDEIERFNNRLREIEDLIISFNNKKQQQLNEQEIFKKYKHIDKLDRLVVETFISKIIMGKVDKETKKRTINIVWNICSS